MLGVIVLGACASVLTAWVGAMMAPLAWGPEKPIELSEGQLWARWPLSVPWPLLYPPSDMARASGRVLSATRYAYHHGETMDGIGWSERVQMSKSVDLYDAGWPWPALRWTSWREERRHFGGPVRARFDHKSASAVASGWPAPAGLSRIGADRRLPLTPRWGLLWDTLIFSGGIAALLFGPAMGRRVMRGWRGRCLACGYDRRGLPAGAVCPECGRGVGCGGTSVVEGMG
jgi:hypothetical protein